MGRSGRVAAIRMRIAVVSLFPSMLREALAHGVLGRAVEREVLEVTYFEPRDHTQDVHRTVDDSPYGGGPGMVLKVEPLRDALGAARAVMPAGTRAVYLGADGVHPSPAGRQKVARLLLDFLKTDDTARAWFVKK